MLDGATFVLRICARRTTERDTSNATRLGSGSDKDRVLVGFDRRQVSPDLLHDLSLIVQSIEPFFDPAIDIVPDFFVPNLVRVACEISLSGQTKLSSGTV